MVAFTNKMFSRRNVCFFLWLPPPNCCYRLYLTPPDPSSSFGEILLSKVDPSVRYCQQRRLLSMSERGRIEENRRRNWRRTGFTGRWDFQAGKRGGQNQSYVQTFFCPSNCRVRLMTIEWRRWSLGKGEGNTRQQTCDKFAVTMRMRIFHIMTLSNWQKVVLKVKAVFIYPVSWKHILWLKLRWKTLFSNVARLKQSCAR
jgi:hypothetical protein